MEPKIKTVDEIDFRKPKIPTLGASVVLYHEMTSALEAGNMAGMC